MIQLPRQEKISVTDFVKFHKPPNMHQLLALIEQNIMGGQAKGSATATPGDEEQHDSSAPDELEELKAAINKPKHSEDKEDNPWTHKIGSIKTKGFGARSIWAFIYLFVFSWFAAFWTWYSFL